MKALIFERNVPRFAAARLAGSWQSGRGATVGPLRLVDTEAPQLPGPGWVRVRPLLSGICGSDLATVDGRSSRYFEDIVSFPFVPGHEVVGAIEEPSRESSLPAGRRVVLEPVLGCQARDIDPPCRACEEGRTGNCERIGVGHLRPGLQTGYCADTGGGWSKAGFVAHHSQLHACPEDLSDSDAVMMEPVACATHAALRAAVDQDEIVAVLGAGSLGLAVIGALSHLAARGISPTPSSLLVGARYAHQRQLAIELGATTAVEPQQLGRVVRRHARSLVFGRGSPTSASVRLTGGADVVFDCVGSAASIEEALSLVRPRGRVVLVGMPGKARIDLAALWQREIALLGAYAYGTEQLASQGAATPMPTPTFDLAFDVVRHMRAGRLVSASYPIERFEEAIAHAGAVGRRGSVKVVFDLQHDAPPTPRSSLSTGTEKRRTFGPRRRTVGAGHKAQASSAVRPAPRRATTITRGET